MKMDFNNFFEMMKVFTYSELNKDFFKEDTQKRVTKCLLKLDENKSIPSTMVDEVAELLTTSAEEGFENGFKTVCELLQMIFISNNQQNIEDKKGMVFNDEDFFKMIYFFNDFAYSIDIVSDETNQKILELDNLLTKELSSEQYSKISSKIDIIEADLQSDCFKSGLFTGINLMKYLLK